MRLLKLIALAAAAAAIAAAAGAAQGEPGRDFDAILRPAAEAPANGFGLVRFRQPRDAKKVVHLNVRVSNLLPNHRYELQRATDGTVDDKCTGTNWLTLGRLLQPRPIVTNARGARNAALSRDLSMVPTGTELDIHFRLIDATTQVVALQSFCYQFTLRQ